MSADFGCSAAKLQYLRFGSPNFCSDVAADPLEPEAFSDLSVLRLNGPHRENDNTVLHFRQPFDLSSNWSN